jgi:proteasome activator subunit 4
MLTSTSDLVASTSSWDVKATVFGFLKVFIPRYSLVLTDKQTKAVLALCETGLADARVDVRLSAKATAISLICCVDMKASSRDRFIKRLFKAAGTKLGADPSPADLSTRHGGVLGLSAFVESHPYDLPDYLPAILARLAGHINDPPPIKKELQAMFASFKTTHQDQWETKWKDQFTEEQLTAIAEVEVAPTYFA